MCVSCHQRETGRATSKKLLEQIVRFFKRIYNHIKNFFVIFTYLSEIMTMKRPLITIATILTVILFSAVSCADNEPFVNIKAIEWQIYTEIKSHRINNGVPTENPFAHQFIMVKEAQLFSAKQAATVSDPDTTGISIHWDIIHDKIAGGYNDMTLLQSTTSTSAEEIVAYWASDSTTNAMMLKDYSQCGVGVEYGNGTVAYVTVLLMKVDS